MRTNGTTNARAYILADAINSALSLAGESASFDVQARIVIEESRKYGADAWYRYDIACGNADHWTKPYGSVARSVRNSVVFGPMLIEAINSK